MVTSVVWLDGNVVYDSKDTDSPTSVEIMSVLRDLSG